MIQKIAILTSGAWVSVLSSATAVLEQLLLGSLTTMVNVPTAVAKNVESLFTTFPDSSVHSKIGFSIVVDAVKTASSFAQSKAFEISTTKSGKSVEPVTLTVAVLLHPVVVLVTTTV